MNSLSSLLFILNNPSKNSPYKRHNLNCILSEATFSKRIWLSKRNLCKLFFSSEFIMACFANMDIHNKQELIIDSFVYDSMKNSPISLLIKVYLYKLFLSNSSMKKINNSKMIFNIIKLRSG